jgi:signal transduction histidine kinase
MLCALMTVGAGFVIFFDFATAMADDISAAELWLRRMDLAGFFTVLALLAFVRVYLKAGSRWLMMIIGTLWACALIADIVSSESFLRTRISDFSQLETAWGEPYALAVGVVSPWKHLADVANALVFVFLLQATLIAKRNGLRRRSIVVGGSSIAFVLVVGIVTPLQDAGVVGAPLITSFAFLIIVIALASQLIDDAFNANRSMLEVERLRRAMTLGEMVGGLAHEINQPLAAILSNAQAAARFLKSDDVDLDEIRAIVDDIVADEKRASGFIRSLRQMLERKEVENFSADVNAAVRRTAAIMQGELHTSDVNLQLELSPSLRPARIDELQLQQVLINLILNAVRAAAEMREARRTVSIRTSSTGDGIEVSVLDRGPGITADKKDSLFQPYASKSEGGLGIGLVLCKHIIERYSGEIRAEQRKRGGAAFRFTLPFSDEYS